MQYGNKSRKVLLLRRKNAEQDSSSIRLTQFVSKWVKPLSQALTDSPSRLICQSVSQSFNL